jgi:hypothetical protein
LLLEIQRITVQCLVALDGVATGITLVQLIAQPILGNQLLHLGLQRGGIGLEVLERGHRAPTQSRKAASVANSGLYRAPVEWTGKRIGILGHQGPRH